MALECDSLEVIASRLEAITTSSKKLIGCRPSLLQVFFSVPCGRQRLGARWPGAMRSPAWTRKLDARSSISSQMGNTSMAFSGRFICRNTKTSVTAAQGARTLRTGLLGRTTRNKKLLGAPGIATRSILTTRNKKLPIFV